MKQFGKWLLVIIVTIIALKYTYGLLYNVFQPFSDFLITHLSFPDWLANFHKAKQKGRLNLLY